MSYDLPLELDELLQKLSEIEKMSVVGDRFSQRIQGDLQRIMNTAHLNCDELRDVLMTQSISQIELES